MSFALVMELISKNYINQIIHLIMKILIITEKQKHLTYVYKHNFTYMGFHGFRTHRVKTGPD